MKKAQFAMEYLMVVGFSILLTIPLVWYLYQGYDDMKQDVNVEHLAEVAREISFQIEKVFYQGPGSRTTISVYFPQGVTLANINRLDDASNFGWIDFEIERFPGTITHTINARICQNVSLKQFSGPHNIIISTNITTGCVIIQEN